METIQKGGKNVKFDDGMMVHYVAEYHSSKNAADLLTKILAQEIKLI